jgi:hypothetical protein
MWHDGHIEGDRARPMTSYQDIRRRVEELTPDEQIRLLEELAVLVRRRSSLRSRSILELQGLGKEIWQGIDAQQYVDQERDSWNG